MKDLTRASIEEPPAWLRPLADAAGSEGLLRGVPQPFPPGSDARRSAVLVLFGPDGSGPDRRPRSGEGPPGELLLIERASGLRQHAGQPAFPGGALDAEDGDPDGAGPVRAALREAREETGLDPSGVRVFGQAPALYLSVSRFLVTPVLGWWERPSPVGVVDPSEVAEVFRVPLVELLDPANRATVRHPSGVVGPAFTVRGHLVWGFTASIIAALLWHGGWERPWDETRMVPLRLPPARRAEA